MRVEACETLHGGPAGGGYQLQMKVDVAEIVVRRASLGHREIEHGHPAAIVDDDVHRCQVGLDAHHRDLRSADLRGRRVEMRQQGAPHEFAAGQFRGRPGRGRAVRRKRG
jgi:hypothetical protein